MRGKKYLWIPLILTLLASMAMVSVPVQASPAVRFYVDPEVTGGVAVGTIIKVDVRIESPPEWENTPDGIVGWRLYVKVDPAVLEPVKIDGATTGYFLYEFCQTYEYYTNEPSLLYTVDKEGGLFIDVSEFLFAFETLGVGAGGSGKLATLWFKSKSLTDYSPIDLYEAYYDTITAKVPVDIVEDGHYNLPPPLEPPVASFTWEPETPKPHETVAFNGCLSYDPDGTIVEYAWDFENDGVIDAYGHIVDWVYTIEGIFTVNLTVTDDDGLTDTATADILVAIPPVPDLVRRSAWPEKHHFVVAKFGNFNILHARMGNPSDISYDVYVRFTIKDAKDGTTLGTIDSAIITLAAGAIPVDTSAPFDVRDFPTLTKAYVLAELLYWDGTEWVEGAKDKRFTFAIVR